MEIKKLIKANKGFTLIELMVYIGILTILIGIGADIFTFVIRSYQRAEVISSIELLGDNILTQIEQDIRVAQNVEVTNSSATGEITLYFSDGSEKKYTFVSCNSNDDSGSVSAFDFSTKSNFFGNKIHLKKLSNLDYFVRTTDNVSYDMVTVSFALASGGSTPCTGNAEYTSYFQTISNLRGGVSN